MNVGKVHVTNILFSTPLVPEIIAGRKTETRRTTGDTVWPLAQRRLGAGDEVWLRVRETWAQCFGGLVFRADFPPGTTGDEALAIKCGTECTGGDHRWRPSIYLPTWASRLYLPVTEVRRERLTDITGEGALAEGVLWQRDDGTWSVRRELCDGMSAYWKHHGHRVRHTSPAAMFRKAFRDFANLHPHADALMWVITWDAGRVRSTDPREGAR